MDENKKQIKEQFVTGLTGSSMVDVVGLTIFVCTMFCFDTIIKWIVPDFGKFPAYVQFLIESCYRFLPTVIIFSFANDVFPEYSVWRNSTSILVPLFIFGVWFMIKPPKSLGKQKQNLFQWLSPKKLEMLTKRKGNLPFLTEYRFIMMIATCVAILAIDFHVCPRYFAKTEFLGVSMMDVGVGGFVFSGGLVSPAARSNVLDVIMNPKFSASHFIKKTLIEILTKNAKLLTIGVGKFIGVLLLNYQTHVSEYGYHWNFFLTLACVAIFCQILEIFFTISFYYCTQIKKFFAATEKAALIWFLIFYLFIVGIGFSLIPQILLMKFGFLEMILDESNRDRNFLYSNKEGIFTTMGYFALFCLGTVVGKLIFISKDKKSWNRLVLFILPSTIVALFFHLYIPSYFVLRNNPISKSMGKDISLSVFLNPIHEFIPQLKGLSNIKNLPQENQFFENVVRPFFWAVPSRRILNLPYILFTLLFNIPAINMLMFWDSITIPVGEDAIENENEDGNKNMFLGMRERLNSIQLQVFLFANVMTGVVNFFFDTYNASKLSGFVIILGYMYAICVFGVMRGKKSKTVEKSLK